MIRYIAIARPPRADWIEEDRSPLLVGREVVVADDEPVKTGLLDHNGTPLYRTGDKVKIGFVA